MKRIISLSISLITFFLFAASPCLRAQAFLPTAFTPNGDGLNDILRIVGVNISSFNFTVCGENGLIIFSTTNINEGWEGLLPDGSMAPAGIYQAKWSAIIGGGTVLEDNQSIMLFVYGENGCIEESIADYYFESQLYGGGFDPSLPSSETFCDATSIEGDGAIAKLGIFPNPVVDQLRVYGLQQEHFTASILNSGGQLCKAISTSTSSIDVSDLGRGTYFLLIDNGKSEISLPFVK